MRGQHSVYVAFMNDSTCTPSCWKSRDLISIRSNHAQGVKWFPQVYLCKLVCVGILGCRNSGFYSVGILGCRNNGLSEYWAVGIFGCNRIIHIVIKLISAPHIELRGHHGYCLLYRSQRIDLLVIYATQNLLGFQHAITWRSYCLSDWMSIDVD